MGLDVANALFGNFRLNWAGTVWFGKWCDERELPNPFIGWASGCNDGDPCHLGIGREYTDAAVKWCARLERREPAIAALGKELFANPPKDLFQYLYPKRAGGNELPEDEWARRTVAAWYAILRNGIAHGDTLRYC